VFAGGMELDFFLCSTESCRVEELLVTAYASAC
jgi:hypothetical protein